MRLATVSVIAVGLVAAAAPVLHAPAAAQTAPSRVLDRTFRCAVGVDGGIRSVNMYAWTGVRDFDDRTKWHTPPHLQLNPAQRTSIIRVRGGGAVSEPYTATWASTVLIHGCARVSARVPLETRGLSGGRASEFGDRYQCPAPRTGLVRVRVEFAERVRVGRESRAHVTGGSLAVRTESGKPIVYADVHEFGRARLFAARSCIPE